MNKTTNNMIVLSDNGKDRITILDGDSGNVIKNIYVPANSGPHGITVCENGQFLCFSNQYDNCINIYDIHKEHKGEDIGTGATPCHIANVNKKLYVSNSDSDSISVIDMEERNAVMVVSSGRMPHDVIGWKNLIIAGESGSDSLGIIDGNAGEYANRIDLKCAPAHMCIIPGKNTVAVACTEYGIEIKGYICIVDMDSLKMTERIRIGKCLTDIASDSDGRHVYVTDGGRGSVYKVDLNTGLVVSDLYLSGFLSSVSFDENRGRLYVTEGIEDRVYLINSEKGIVEKVIEGSGEISHIAFI